MGRTNAMEDSSIDKDIESFMLDADDGYGINEQKLRETGVTEEKITRMRRRHKNKDTCLIYPDNPRKA